MNNNNVAVVLKDLIFVEKLKKGHIGECIVKEKFSEMYPYYDILEHKKNKAHWVDFTAMNKKNKDILYCEVKTKKRFEKYLSTGFDIKHYKEYISLHYDTKKEILIYFVDDEHEDIRVLPITKAIKLEEQNKSFKDYKNKIISFKLQDMNFVGYIPDNYKKKLTDVNIKIKILSTIYDNIRGTK